MAKSFGEKVIQFNRTLQYRGNLPPGFRVINPYLDNPETLEVMRRFYQKFYNDTRKRKLILGINPGRHGAGVTGVPFTDTKRLESECGIAMQSAHTHEMSSVFIYDMIAAFGGAAHFYSEFYINSPFPLAIVRKTPEGKWVNANYYDSPGLAAMLEDFMTDCLRTHVSMGIDTSAVFVLGKKNAAFIEKINLKAKLFQKLCILEHPRYIQQYRSRDKALFIHKYLLAFAGGC